MIKGFFFDLDGTVVDTHRANFLAYQRALQDVGVKIDFNDFKQTIGSAAKSFLPILAPGLQQADYKLIVDHKAIYYREVMLHTTANQEILQFIKDIKNTCQVALVTTAKTKNVEAVLGHHKLGGLFDCVVTQEDVKELKPHPEAYLRALRLTGLKPKEAVAFEDSESGVAAAKAAGIPVITIKDFWL